MSRNLYIILTVVAVLALVIAVSSFSSPEEEKPGELSTATEVEVFTVGSDVGQSSFTAYGQVVSISGVDVYPQIQGVVASVRGSLGDRVRSGQTIVTLQNSSQRQQLLSARASLANAQANYQLVVKSADKNTIANLENQLESAHANRAQAETALESSLSSSLSIMENSLQNDIDNNFFARAGTQSTSLTILADPISDKYPLEEKRKQLGALQKSINEAEGDIQRAYNLTFEFSNVYLSLLDNLITHISDFSEGQMSKATQERYLNSLRPVKQQVNAQKQSLSSAHNAYVQAGQAITTAENNLADLREGASSEEIQIAQAQVAQARSGVESAEIAVGQTIISSPVAGEISKIDARVGSLVSPQSVLFSVVNEQALRIDTKVNTEIARGLQVGTRALVDGSVEARVSAIAPGISATTGQVDVQLMVPGGDSQLTSGTGVSVQFFKEQVDTDATIYIPISAIFVRDGVSYVYVLSEENTASLRAISVVDLFGAEVEVTQGLEQGERVITNAREVDDGEEVEVISD